MAFRLISFILSLSLFCQQAGIAYASGELNLANYLSSMRNAAVQPDIFQPARLRYISYDINNNDFKLLLDKGDAKLNNATRELFNYFLIGLALPNDTFWVNLRPDAPENIIDPLLEKTDIGKIFLEADLQLKKDTASLTSPQTPEGKAYWDNLYKKAGELFGTENITIPTITRPWIVPNEVIVRETEDSAYIYKATLKVMLESDYLIGRGGSRTAPTPDQYSFSDPRLKELNEYSSQIIRETIIPKLTKEINSSKRYAQLRQVYYSLVLSRWFKQKYSNLGSIRAQGTLPVRQAGNAPVNSYIGLIDSGNLANLNSQEPCDKQTYFQAYQKSFKDGEYNLKETVASPYGQSIRNYISGGVGLSASPLRPGEIKIEHKHNLVTAGLKTGWVPASQSISTGSPIEMAFWNGETREKGTLTYVRWDELGEDRREKILNNKPFFMEDKTQSNFDVIEAIKGRSGELLSNIRFAFSESGVLEGYIVISKEGNSIAAINAVAGATQWIETALIIAGIRELADKLQPGYSIELKNVLSYSFYQIMKLQKLIKGNLESEKMLQVNLSGGTADLYQAGIEKLIDGYDDYILEEVKNEGHNSRTIKKSSSSPLTDHILSYEEQSKIVEVKKRLSILTIEVAHLLNAYPDLKDPYGEVLNKIKEFDRQNDILSLAGIMKEFYSAVSRQDVKESYGNKIADKIKKWAEAQDIVNKAIETIKKSIDEDMELEHNQLMEVPPGYRGERKDYCDDVKMLLKKKDFAGVASWMTHWWRWQENGDKVKKWGEIAGELKIINMRSGLPHYFSGSPLIQNGQETGGIDLTDRMMRLKIERVGSFADLKLVLPEVKNAQDIDLDKEFRQIEAIASSGIVPNSRRILELFSACYSLGEFAQRLPQVISCLKASSAIQEKLAIDSDDDFRMCLLVPEVFSDGR